MTTQATSDAQDTTKATDTTTTTADTKATDTKAADKSTTTDTSTTTTDTKAADTKAADKTDTSKTDAKDGDKSTDTKTDDKTQSKAPDKYELKLSENSLLEPSVIDEVAAIAREQGLSNEQAQERLGQIEAQVEAKREANIKAWEKEVTADKELGGEKLQSTQANITRFASRFAPKDSPIAALLHRSGYGSHPAVVRLMNDIGKAMAEDKPLGHGGASGGAKDAVTTLYDHPSNYGSNS